VVEKTFANDIEERGIYKESDPKDRLTFSGCIL
jgi:hypothetical protein